MKKMESKEYLEKLRRFYRITDGKEYSDAKLLKLREKAYKIKERLKRKEKIKKIVVIVGITILFILVPILGGMFTFYPK